jgi:5-methylcytosine-specific restriction enzyme A
VPIAVPRHCPRPGHPAFLGRRCPLCEREYDKRRGPPSQRGYGRDWLAFRADFLLRHPRCCVPGCDQPATQVDHIVALRDGGARLDPANCRPMCVRHHSRRTITDQGLNRR